MPDIRPLAATYRVQMHADFPLARAREIAGYLDRLGVTHLYSSPILAARPGSTHGYDVVDPTRVNPELGDDAALAALAAELHGRAMGIVLDIVPNHMGIGPANPYWWDVLTHGQASRHAAWFDVDWAPARASLRGRILLPVLGAEREEVLARGEIRAVLEDGAFRVAYFDNRFPIDPTTVHRLFAFAHEWQFPGDAAADAVQRARDELIAEGGDALPRDRATDAAARLARLAGEDAAVGAYVTFALEQFGRGPDGAYRLGALLDLQAYDLVFWRRAAREINYRRFFDVNDLAAVRVEDPGVYAATHARVLGWIADGTIDGVRVDHVDGLRDPLRYLERLRADLAAETAREVPLFVEKILSPGERLRASWPIWGTTGYEFLNDLESLFLDGEGTAVIERGYRRLPRGRGAPPDFRSAADEGKHYVLRGPFLPDVQRLVRPLLPALAADARAEPSSGRAVRHALEAILAGLPVYRTYVDERGDPDPADVAVVERARTRARAEAGVHVDTVDALADLLLLRGPVASDAAGREFVMRFQQTSGPVTAKGVEDTALYRYVPLASRSEVGGDPDRALDDPVGHLHAANAERAARWPRTLLCTNTHDTKRTADLRARLDVLSEIPDEWLDTVAGWRRMNRAHRLHARGGAIPDAAAEYLLYQTLVGVWPAGAPADAPPSGPARAALRERVAAYMQKALREAKTRTSWTAPDEAYERGVAAFIDAILADEAGFLPSLHAFVGRVARPGLWNALARTVVHLTSPGVSDVYQGDELWNFALVDPDNRRPVDYAERDRLLAALEGRAREGAALRRELLATPEDGRVKLFLTWRALQERRRHPALFVGGRYRAVTVEGEHAAHALAFVREGGGAAALIVAPRLTMRLGGAQAAPVGDRWGDTRLLLPEGLAARSWRDALGGEPGGVERVTALSTLLADFPVAFRVADA